MFNGGGVIHETPCKIRRQRTFKPVHYPNGLRWDINIVIHLHLYGGVEPSGHVVSAHLSPSEEFLLSFGVVLSPPSVSASHHTHTHTPRRPDLHVSMAASSPPPP